MGKAFVFGVIVSAIALYFRLTKRSQPREGGILGSE